MPAAPLPIHFFTLVLNGEPFIRYHLNVFKTLQSPWHWHIIEGLADLKHDTAWSLPYGASVPPDVAKNGRSVDGTAEYLDQIAAENPGQITIYRPPNGRMWDGKLEMVNAPVKNLPADCILWEVDSDELWTPDQITRMRQLFQANPERTSAVFYCWYFVSPTLVINRRLPHPELQWRRAWRFRRQSSTGIGPNDPRWAAHEPPMLAVPIPGTDKAYDVTTQNPFFPQELEAQGLVFQHFAYVTEAQLRFKETYYGYKNITEIWRKLQQATQFPLPLKSYFHWPWVDQAFMVSPASACGVAPLAREENGRWTLTAPRLTPDPPENKRGVLFIHRAGGGGDELLERAMRSVRAVHPELPIHVHRTPATATPPGLDKASMASVTPFEETLYLDADTVVLGRLDFGFEMAARHGLACCIAECPWARRYLALHGDLVEYDTGVLFFTKNARPIFDAWEATVRTLDSSFLATNQQNQLVKVPFSDQAAFAQAVAHAPAPPFVLPLNWNLHPGTQRAWHGPIKIWHDQQNPAPEILNFCTSQYQAQSPIQFASLNR